MPRGGARASGVGPPGPGSQVVAAAPDSPNALLICQSTNVKRAVKKPQDFVTIRPDKGSEKLTNPSPRTTPGDRKMAGVVGTFHHQGRKGATQHGASLPPGHLPVSPHHWVPPMPCLRSDWPDLTSNKVSPFRKATRSSGPKGTDSGGTGCRGAAKSAIQATWHLIEACWDPGRDRDLCQGSCPGTQATQRSVSPLCHVLVGREAQHPSK